MRILNYEKITRTCLFNKNENLTKLTMTDALIIDFGSQYTQLMVSLLQYKIGVSVKLVPYPQCSKDYISGINPKCIILSGGPQSVYEGNVFENMSKIKEWLDHIVSNKIPVMGVCFGLQLLVNYFGGKVEKSEFGGEFAKASLCQSIESENSQHMSVLLKNVLLPGIVWMSHMDVATQVPNNFVTYGYTTITKHAVIEDHTNNVFGVQYHPEVKDTKSGKRMYRNFLSYSGCKFNKKENLLNQLIEMRGEILSNVEEDEVVLIAVSGGVDSSVLCEFVSSILPNNVMSVFVDHGMMRKGEVKEICERFEHVKGFKCIDASAQFLNSLNGVSDPEKKRKIIGKTFIDVFENEVLSNPKIKILAQGTIYPDVIESCGLNNTAKAIKSHHNVGGLPERLKLRLMEPFKYLFKDQIREIGKYLNVNMEAVKRHPFPGPGLGIRIMGEITKEFIDITQRADDIFIKELREKNLYDQVSQAYAGFFPVKTVGVVGDNPRYGYTIVLRAVKTIDFMTARPFEFPAGFLEDVSTKIINQIESVSRVFYDVTSKPPATIELE